MKNLLLILVTISILSCTKKQDDPKPVVTTTQKQSTPISSCSKDSSWVRTHPKTTSLYYFKETCNHITITFAVTKQVVTLLKPTDEKATSNVTNYPNYSNFRNSTSSSKFYYNIRYSSYFKCIIYEVEEANFIGVGGPGMKMK
jgi:hypothetical protein